MRAPFHDDSGSIWGRADYQALAGLLIVGGLVRGLVTLPMQHPGYMDAAYSYAIALNLARGNGLNEPFLWNYLDDPSGLPHPSHLYWMPLPTLLAWLGVILGGQSYRAAQIPFVLLSLLLPLISYYVARLVSPHRLYAVVAGMFAIFSGFFVPYWTHTDNFTPFALAGSVCLIATWRAWEAVEQGNVRPYRNWCILAGAMAALAQLARADGILLLAISVLWTVLRLRRSPVRALRASAWMIGSFIIVMLPWMVRNELAVGTPWPAYGAQSIWLTQYDDLFHYGRPPSLERYLAWGWDNILRSKLEALWLNVQTVIAVWGMVFLMPLAVWGGRQLRHHPLFQLAGVYALALFGVMTFVFTFPGPRGGLFHSSGAVLPFLYAAALAGMDDLIRRVATLRPTWQQDAARRVFAGGMVMLALLVSGFVLYRGVVVATRWRQLDSGYLQVAECLRAHGESDALVMVGDPPGWWYTSGIPAIVVPNEPPETVMVVARRYRARYLILDANRPAPLAALYEGTQIHSDLQRIATFNDAAGQPVHVWRIR
ncbi:MAG: glycosyltransferase family 39 protein [Anaerolineae bacterium]|nr:glycosyltransferase family 39 protein [Anaerolineae bacterium]